MRFLISDALSGACLAAIIVFAAGHAPKITGGPASDATVPAHEGVERSQSLVQSSAELVPQPATRDIARAEEGEQSSATIETASITGGDGPHGTEALSLARLPSFPAIDPTARRPSGGLGAAADGGIDAYVPPIVRQRPHTPPLTVTSDAKPKAKEKVKSAKTKNSSKQASRTVTPASVRR
jgi:hypothetical protein